MHAHLGIALLWPDFQMHGQVCVVITFERPFPDNAKPNALVPAPLIDTKLKSCKLVKLLECQLVGIVSVKLCHESTDLQAKQISSLLYLRCSPADVLFLHAIQALTSRILDRDLQQ